MDASQYKDYVLVLLFVKYVSAKYAIAAMSLKSLGKRQLNGEFGNSRDASVHADGAKSRFPKRVARALRRRNSLRMAIQIWGAACPCYRFRDCGPHSAQTEQSGETALLISLSQHSQFHFVARPNVGRF